MSLLWRIEECSLASARGQVENKIPPPDQNQQAIPPRYASVSSRAAYLGGGSCGCSGADGICNREGKLLKKPGPPFPPVSIRLCRAWYGGGEVYLCCCLAVRDWCPKG
ncbi:hypothetical protein WA026_004301 [Henosepilachna vigintioctopunctata]|uniref:Uncharacterized protein n=1 Tax=Henosepilachna vigintioctopunctata TaxID=420089 RepID=A0AAW1V7B5_9CUCU